MVTIYQLQILQQLIYLYQVPFKVVSFTVPTTFGAYKTPQLIPWEIAWEFIKESLPHNAWHSLLQLLDIKLSDCDSCCVLYRLHKLYDTLGLC